MDKIRWIILVIIAFIFVGLWFTMIFTASNHDWLLSIIVTLGACVVAVILVFVSALIAKLLE